MWCCDSWFPPLPLCCHATAVFSRMAPESGCSPGAWKTYFYSSWTSFYNPPPLQKYWVNLETVVSTCQVGNSFPHNKNRAQEKDKGCLSAELISGVTGVLSWVGFVKSPSEISIDYHGNCTGPVVAIVMPDGEKLCIWLPQRIAHWMLNSDECPGSKVNRAEHKCRQGTTFPQCKIC